MRYSVLLLGCLLLCIDSFGQGRRLCRAMEMDSIRRANDPSIGSLDDFEMAMQRNIVLGANRIENRMVVTLPVIVHIVHDGEDVGVGTNLSVEQIMSQIDVLNEDYRRVSGTPGFNNDPVGADIEIEFCPATLDPNGDPLLERGINRINRNDFSWPAPPWSDLYIDNNIKPATFWDPDSYLNIWVAEITGNVLGFAQFPNMASLSGLPADNGGASTDGIVVAPTFFGRTGNVSFPYNQGRTATHEIGHWLGVFHPEGRDRGGCNQDDFCADTPQSDAQNFGCDVGHVSCGTEDMVRNYMDSSDDACMNIFTQDQKTRMRTVLTNSPRRGILTSANSCTEDLPPAVAFTSNSTIICAGQSIRFSDASVNNPDEWNWSFPGGIPSTSTDPNPVVTYPTAGIYSVTLEAGNSFGTRTLTLTNQITVNSSDPSIVFEEQFENGIPASWTIDNPDNALTWETQAAGGSRAGNNSAYVQLYFYAAVGARDGLISPTINLSEVDNISFNFDYSYVQEAGSERDSLIIYASTDGGNTFPDVLIRMGDDGMQSFATAPPTGSNPGPFVPAVDDDWCYAGDGAECVEIDLSAYVGQSQFALRFETVSDFGNNIYLDNIRIEGTCRVVGIEPDLSALHAFKLYPNPTSGQLKMSLDNLHGEAVKLSVFDLQGRELMQKNLGERWGLIEENLLLELPTSGAYLMKVEVDDAVFFEKFLLQVR